MEPLTCPSCGSTRVLVQRDMKSTRVCQDCSHHWLPPVSASFTSELGPSAPIPSQLKRCQPGDVIAVRTGGMGAAFIRWGEALRGWPNLDNHIVVVDSVQDNGIVVGIEGRPGGVGRVDVGRYFTIPYVGYSVGNFDQPKTPEQRAIVVQVVRNMLKVGYDWDAIAQDALVDLGIPSLWLEKWRGTSPAHVVCSSLAAWAYFKAQLKAPKQEDMRHIQPANWTQFILDREWASA